MDTTMGNGSFLSAHGKNSTGKLILPSVFCQALGKGFVEAPYHYIAKDWLNTILSSVSAGAATTMAYASI